LSKPCTVDAILFDFGGVLADERFRNGLLAIARRNGLNPEGFAGTGFELDLASFCPRLMSDSP